MAANQLQRWVIILAAYMYDIQYKLTAKHGNADNLSRLPIPKDQQDEQDHSESSELNLIHAVQLEQLLLKATDIAKATEKDPVLAQVYHFIQCEWPESKSNLDKVLHTYFVRKLQLTKQFTGCDPRQPQKSCNH